MDRGLHSNYSISLITLSQVGRPINALTQMDPATLTANAPASYIAAKQAECQTCHLPDRECETVPSTGKVILAGEKNPDTVGNVWKKENVDF